MAQKRSRRAGVQCLWTLLQTTQRQSTNHDEEGADSGEKAKSPIDRTHSYL
jgi:hypothetical protein